MTVKQHINGIEAIILEGTELRATIIPGLGGKIFSLFNKPLNKEFLWINPRVPLQNFAAGAEYDPNFIGGIDELFPNDVPETIDGIAYPDHGELWTAPLHYELNGESVTVYGTLPLSGIQYKKSITIGKNATLTCDYSLHNPSNSTKHFLWKLHAALMIKKGDRLITSARKGLVVDPEYSRFKEEVQPFNWPFIENIDASVVPAAGDSMDFFYLYETLRGEMQLLSENEKHLFSYQYDHHVFPYQWWFASYGGFLGYYTAVLEPCTNMPMSVNEAVAKKQSASLSPGTTLSTSVKIFAGEKKNYISA
jgi:hypothetical protein